MLKVLRLVRTLSFLASGSLQLQYCMHEIAMCSTGQHALPMHIVLSYNLHR